MDGQVATEAAWLYGKQFGKRRKKAKEREKQQNDRKALTLNGLLMEGVGRPRIETLPRKRSVLKSHSSFARSPSFHIANTHPIPHNCFIIAVCD
jgi:hypothetical protein